MVDSLGRYFRELEPNKQKNHLARHIKVWMIFESHVFQTILQSHFMVSGVHILQKKIKKIKNSTGGGTDTTDRVTTITKMWDFVCALVLLFMLFSLSNLQ